jgi:hypothetical protein
MLLLIKHILLSRREPVAAVHAWHTFLFQVRLSNAHQHMPSLDTDVLTGRQHD